jgi:hypothetical protein
MGSWIDPMRQKILIAPHLPENIVLFRSLEARRIAMQGRPPAPRRRQEAWGATSDLGQIRAQCGY